MPSITLEKAIKSPADMVFDVVAHLEVFAQAVPAITAAECLTDIERGIGCQYRVARRTAGRDLSTVFEVVEYEPVELVRILSEAGGATWDALFEIRKKGKGSTLIWTLEGTPATLRAKMAAPLIFGAVEKALAPDLDAVKSYCEAR